MENTTKAIAPLSMTEISTMAQAFSKSGFFKDAVDEAKAIVKIVYGRELGVSPVAAMLGIYLTSQGKLELDSGLIASLIKESRRYAYRVLKLDHTACEIEFTDNGQVVGISRFDEADARRAGLGGKDTYQKYPRNLYFARALTNGARWYCPNLFGGAVYARGEIDEANTPSEGELRAEIKEVETESSTDALGTALATPAPEPKPALPKRPYAPDALRRGFLSKIEKNRNIRVTDGQRGVLVGKLDAFIGEGKRHELFEALTGYKSSKDLSGPWVHVLLQWASGDAEFVVQEANLIINEFLKAQGQKEIEWTDLGSASETESAPTATAPQRFEPPPLEPGFVKLEPGPVIPSLKEKDAANPVRQADPITKDQRAALKKYFTVRANGNEDAALKEMHAKFVAKFGHTMYEATRIEAAKVLDEIEAADPF